MTAFVVLVFVAALSLGFFAGLVVGIIAAESHQRRRLRELYFERFGEEAP